MKYSIFILLTLTHPLLGQQHSGNRDHSIRQLPANNAATAVSAEKTIELTVTGLMNVRADAYVAHFHIVQVGATAEKTDALMNARILKFKTGLARIGVDTSGHVATDMISFVPKFDFNIFSKRYTKHFNEEPDAFELQKNVIVRFEKNAQIDKIVTAAAEAEIYDLVKVDHYLTDIKRHYDQLRKECLTALNEKVLAYEFAGIRLDTLARTIADDFGTVLPEKRYAGYSSVARPSFHAVKDAGSGSAKISNSQLAASRYYDALPYDEFDVVINPVIDQPVVQLTYQFKIRYYLSDEKRQAEYHFIGANGVIQKLDLK